MLRLLLRLLLHDHLRLDEVLLLLLKMRPGIRIHGRGCHRITTIQLLNNLRQLLQAIIELDPVR